MFNNNNNKYLRFEYLSKVATSVIKKNENNSGGLEYFVHDRLEATTGSADKTSAISSSCYAMLCIFDTHSSPLFSSFGGKSLFKKIYTFPFLFACDSIVPLSGSGILSI